ncbi:MAG: hypothetical protein RL367_141 [Pseudomonadota bacterium]
MTGTSTTTAFEWHDSALQSQIVRTQPGQSGTSSAFSYDKNAHLTQVVITGAQPRTINYTTDSTGQIMVRTQTNNGSTTAPRQFFFYFNGLRVGEIGNNGTDDIDYAATITANGADGGNGPFRGGSTTGTSYADFDENYAAINTSSGPESGAGSYTVRPGDTLAGIAQSVWGLR